MRQPESREGCVWLSQHFEGIQRFVFSGRQDGDALGQAVRSLRFLLEREPGYAREVRQMALQCAMGAYNAGFLTEMERLVSVGLDGEVMDSSVSAEPALSALLLLCLAEAQLEAGQRLAGLDTLNRMQDRVQEALDEPLIAYARSRELLLRAELNELGREIERARKEYSDAATIASGILKDESHRRDFTEKWIAVVYGPKDATINTQLDALERTGLTLFEQTYLGALLGAARVLAESSAEHARIVSETRTAIGKYGYLKATSPFFLIDLIGTMLPEDAKEFGYWLTKMQGTAEDTLPSKLPIDDLAPSLREVVQRKFTKQEAIEERDRNIWQVAMQLGLARSREKSGDIEGAQRDYYEAMGLAIQGRLGLPQAVTAGLLLTFLTEHDVENTDAMAHIFLVAYIGAIELDPRVFYEPQYRALFDKPIAALIERKLASDELLSDESTRRQTAILLDMLRTQVMPPLGVLISDLREEEKKSSEDGLWQISNTIDRIAESLRGRPGIVALIMHGSQHGPIFVVIDSNGIMLERAEVEFIEAVSVLEKAADQALWRMQAGCSDGGDSELERAGQKVFDALPSKVRTVISSTATLLIAPDFRVDYDVIPFELMHDGKDFLLSSRVVARFTSLHHLARTLDTRLERPPRRRALVVAAPDVKGYPPLFGARPEVEAIRGQLLAAGFDVPEISEERLTDSFFIDRLSYVDVLHIAAHGESKAAIEYIVLPNGRKMDVDDLQRKSQRSLPFVYLNTCQLGETRYLGGGQYRGLAFTLSELGAPAVIANTTDVLDDVSSELARIFYEKAINRPVGAAWLEARRHVIESGQSPAVVARVILLGSPWWLLTGETEEGICEDPARDLLDAFFYNADAAEREEAWLEAQRCLKTDGGIIRLKAAIDLVLSASEAQSTKGSEWLQEIDGAIDLADALEHSGAQALLRYTKAYLGLERGESEALEWLRDSVPYLKSRKDFGGYWANILMDVQAKLKRAEMTAKGQGFERRGTESKKSDEVLNAFIDVILATQQEAEEEEGPTKLRESEKSLEDIAWNAVVIGHPNRFEDVGEASQYADQLARKLINRGHLPAGSRPFASAMLVGLLWFLWSTQKGTYLERELAEGQEGTLRELIKDIADHWSPPDNEPWYSLVRDFPKRVDEVLAYLKELPWERVHPEIKAKVEDLTCEAKEVLLQVEEKYPEALPACTALVTGTLAVKNTYSPLQGSVPEDKYKKLTDAVWSLNSDNEERFYLYLWRGFESVRNREPDELEKWRYETVV